MPLAPPEPDDGTLLDHSGCQETIGYVIDLKPEKGGAACWLDIGPGHLNRNNLLHGGIMAMMLDVACGYAASLSYDAETIAKKLLVYS